MCVCVWFQVQKKILQMAAATYMDGNDADAPASREGSVLRSAGLPGPGRLSRMRSSPLLTCASAASSESQRCQTVCWVGRQSGRQASRQESSGEGERLEARRGKTTPSERTPAEEEKIKLHLGGKFYQGIVIVS